MKLIMTLLVRDESDILAANLEYHYSRGVDYVIATDNLSVDGTSEILKSYQKKGLLQYIYESDDNYAQNHWVTRMARMACEEFGADWVINNDADEFWWPEYGDLKETLNKLSFKGEAASALRTNFLPCQLSPDDNFADFMTIREVDSRNALGKTMPPKICHRAFPNVEVAMGNHSVTRNGNELAVQALPVTIFHFPMRSYAQFANLAAKGGAALARNTELPKEVGLRWRKWNEMFENGSLYAYYQSQIPDQEAIDKGIIEGRFIKDERLKHYLAKLSKSAEGEYDSI